MVFPSYRQDRVDFANEATSDGLIVKLETLHAARLGIVPGTVSGRHWWCGLGKSGLRWISGLRLTVPWLWWIGRIESWWRWLRWIATLWRISRIAAALRSRWIVRIVSRLLRVLVTVVRLVWICNHKHRGFGERLRYLLSSSSRDC